MVCPCVSRRRGFLLWSHRSRGAPLRAAKAGASQLAQARERCPVMLRTLHIGKQAKRKDGVGETRHGEDAQRKVRK
jgi:hypothetical protein